MNRKSRTAACRSPEQTRPRLLIEYRAPAAAACSHAAAGSTHHARMRSDQKPPPPGPRFGQPGRPTREWSGRLAQTRGQDRQDYVQHGRGRPSVGETPANTVDVFLASAAPPARDSGCPPNRVNPTLLLWRSLTSHARASSASVPHLPDADQSALQPVAGHETSQVPTRSFRTLCGLRPRRSDGISHSDAAHIAFDGSERLGLRNILPFVAQSPTPSDHCVRFAPAVADDCATLASRRRATTLPGPVFHRLERVSFAHITAPGSS